MGSGLEISLFVHALFKTLLTVVQWTVDDDRLVPSLEDMARLRVQKVVPLLIDTIELRHAFREVSCHGRY